MEVTPQLLKEVEFAERWRGYDPGEVDEFLERLGAGVAELRQRLADAEARVEAAERRATAAEARAAHASAEGADVETIQRTLVLAQRTADAAIQDAERQAARTLAAAEERASTMLAEAEAEARRTVDGAHQQLREEIASLELARDALRGDVDLLERHLDEARQRLRASLRDLQEVLDHPELLRTPPVPELSGVTVEPVLPSPAVAGVDAAAAAAAQVLAEPDDDEVGDGADDAVPPEAGGADAAPDGEAERWYPLAGAAEGDEEPVGEPAEVAAPRPERSGLFVTDPPDADAWIERREGDPAGRAAAGRVGAEGPEGQRRGLRRWR